MSSIINPLPIQHLKQPHAIDPTGRYDRVPRQRLTEDAEARLGHLNGVSSTGVRKPTGARLKASTKFNSNSPDVVANKALECAFEGCFANRGEYGLYCAKHASKVRKSGHPEKKQPQMVKLGPEIGAIRDYLDNAKGLEGHPLVRKAGKALRSLLEKPPAKSHAAPLWIRLDCAGVNPSSVVVLVAARILWAMRNDIVTLDDDLIPFIRIGLAKAVLFRLPKQSGVEIIGTRAIKRLGDDLLASCFDLCKALAVVVKEREKLRVQSAIDTKANEAIARTQAALKAVSDRKELEEALGSGAVTLSPVTVVEQTITATAAPSEDDEWTTFPFIFPTLAAFKPLDSGIQ
jgi:hypothetical protein